MDFTQSLLSLSNLTLTRNSVAVITDGHLAVNTGECVCLVGPNGSGKTTLAESLAGSSSCTVNSGSVVFRGKSASERTLEKNLFMLTPADRARHGLYVAFQNVPEFDGVTAETFLYEAFSASHGLRPLRDDFRAKLNELCCVVGLSFAHLERPLFKDFSGGERKRFQLLELLLLRPRLAVLDELDAGLDAEGLQLFFEILKELRAKHSPFKYLSTKDEDCSSKKLAHECVMHEYAAHEDQERESFLCNSVGNSFNKNFLNKEYGCSFLVITHNQLVINALAPERVYALDTGTIREISKDTYRGGIL